MGVTYDHLMSHAVPDAVQEVTPETCLLYALTLGLGRDPLDPDELRFVYEKDLKVLPLMGNVLAYPGFWFQNPAVGVDWHRLVHAEQALLLHRPLPSQATLVGKTRVTGIQDKGTERGALVFVERRVLDQDSGAPVCTIEQTAYLRGDGGCGGNDPAPREKHAVPQRDPDHTVEITVPAQAALLYRLNGDMNPLHADPEVAQAAGFEKPILHGLCTFGIAGVALLKSCCAWETERLQGIGVRFSAPVYPGDTLQTAFWLDGDDISFRTTALERDALVLNHGWATLTPAG